MIKFAKILNEKLCKSSPEALFVFGDNLLGKGKAGQAIIRDEPNAFGVPTKRFPSMDLNAFFSDKEDEYKVVKEKLIFLWNQHLSGKMIVLPESRIGTGLAHLEEKSPKINALIVRFYESAQKSIQKKFETTSLDLFAVTQAYSEDMHGHLNSAVGQPNNTLLLNN